MTDLTITQLAKLAGCTRQAVHRALQAGAFPGAYPTTDEPNAPIKIPAREAQRWLKKRAQTQSA